MGKRYLTDVLETMGHHVDGLKFAGGSFSLFPEDKLRELIDLAHQHDVYVSTGGWIEHVLSHSSDPNRDVDRYLSQCKRLGFDVLEVSCGFLSIPPDDWVRLVLKVNEPGLKAKPEIGIQVMIESEGITENVRSWRTGVIQNILRELPSDKVMFEAADPKVFNWYIREFGADVNLFVDHSQIVQLSCLRMGIWGMADTFGKITTFR
ncbi:putative sulfonate biosynthesis enzyme [Coniochaeta sp. 2T2.1]|nr:putative sulfonate biosynthesis enzyme [Coniochaeta sp. 2T2.1]